METKYYVELCDDIDEIEYRLTKCKNNIDKHGEYGDITKSLKIKEAIYIVQIWKELLRDFY